MYTVKTEKKNTTKSTKKYPTLQKSAAICVTSVLHYGLQDYLL